MNKHLFFVSFFLCLTVSVFAQNNQTTKQTTNEEADEKNSDVVITANVTAKELKFEIVPTPTVEFPGNKPRQTVWEADRTNLPNPVEPGVVYRDIGIRLRIYSRFAEIQRIVLETLDEENPPVQQNQTAPANNPPANNQQNPVKPKR
jgi:hypothetical protein